MTAKTMVRAGLGLLMTLVPVLATPVLGQQPSFVTAPVSVEQAVAAVDECAHQLRADAFDHERLTEAGWVSAIRSEGGDVDVRGYRHPDNMMLLSTVDGADDNCTVMAPLGSQLSLESMRVALGGRLAVPAVRDGSESRWELDDLQVALRPMGGGVGILVVLNRRNR